MHSPATTTTTPATTEKKDDTKTTTTPSAEKWKYYTIKNGDNLWTLANKYGTTVEAIKKLNGFGNKIVLHTGDKIKMPTK